VAPPIEKGSTVLLPNAASLYDDLAVTYGREGLSTHEALTSALQDLEHASVVRLFPSGLAALTGAILAVVGQGDHVLVTDVAYKPTRRFCDRVLGRLGVTVSYLPAQTPPAGVADWLQANTRLIVLESPGSLTFEMQDVPGIARLARERGVLTLVDNTWAAGHFFKPLDHGVDLSAQALTKYVGGHSDVFMGSVAASSLPMTRALDQAVLDFGWAVSPDDAYMMLRGLRTLPTRLQSHQSAGFRVAHWLSEHPSVSRVLHPGLPGSPDHDLWRRDYTGAPGLFSFVATWSDPSRTGVFLDALRVFRLGFSWGGFESLALNCKPQFAVRLAGPAYGGEVIRLSVGLENPDELIADLQVAFERASGV
jgi:cystathionine beta-lyase